MKMIGLIGAGNMGTAILRGVLDAGYLRPEQLCVSDKSTRRMAELSKQL